MFTEDSPATEKTMGEFKTRPKGSANQGKTGTFSNWRRTTRTGEYCGS